LRPDPARSLAVVIASAQVTHAQRDPRELIVSGREYWQSPPP
jgi:hypothetical protein